jgi:hypothetical protein
MVLSCDRQDYRRILACCIRNRGSVIAATIIASVIATIIATKRDASGTDAAAIPDSTNTIVACAAIYSTECAVQSSSNATTANIARKNY